MTSTPGFAPREASHPDLEPHAGPVAWLEEYWEVKPERLGDFVRAYRDEVCSLACQQPGYRGYTVITKLPPYQDEETEEPSEDLVGKDATIVPHTGVWLDGKLQTNRVVNLGAMLRRAHNVVVLHSLDTWAAASGFQTGLAAAHAQRSGGQELGDHLARTLYPLANNHWDAWYRLVETSAPEPPNGTPPLAPFAGPGVTIQEHWLVDPADAARFLDTYRREVYALIRRLPGYVGWSVISRLPAAEGEVPASLPLGPSPAITLPKQGMLMDGEVRTDLCVNFGAFFREAFTLKIYHYMDKWASSDSFPADFSALYASEHDGARAWDRWAPILMPMGRLHWDTYYRIVETSFMP